MQIVFKDNGSKMALGKRIEELVDVIYEHIGVVSAATVQWNGFFFSIETHLGKIRVDKGLKLF